MLLAWLTRLLPAGAAHLNPLTWTGPKSDWHFTVCIHSSEGQQSYRVSDHEIEAFFGHLDKHACKYDGHKRRDKLNRLYAVVSKGLPL